MKESTGFIDPKSTKKSKKSANSVKKITFIVQPLQGGSYFYRCVIPKDLQPFLENKPEFRISLKTGLYCDAKRIARNLDQLAKRLFQAIRIRQKSFPVSILKDKLLEYLQQLLAPSSWVSYSPQRNNYKELRTMTTSQSKAKICKEKRQKEKLLRLEVLEIVLTRLSIEELQLYIEKTRRVKQTKGFFRINAATEFKFEFRKFAALNKDSKRVIPLRLRKITDDFAGIILNDYLNTLSTQEQHQWCCKHGLDDEDIEKEMLKVNPRENLLDTVLVYADDNELFSEIVKLGPKWIAGKLGEVQQVTLANPVLQQLNPQIIKQAAVVEQKQEIDRTCPTLTIAWEDYCENNLKAETVKEYHSSFVAVKTIIGDIPMNHIDEKKIVLFKKTLKDLPANITESMSYADLEKIMAIQGYKQNSKNTKIQKFTRIKTFIEVWNEENKDVQIRLGRLKFTDDTSAEDDEEARDMFEEEHIEKIFNVNDYLAATEGSPAKYWIPLIGLHVGTRINEICQLQLHDIYLLKGIWVFDFNRRTENPIHSKTGKPKFNRIIPIHQNLIDLGFVKFIEQLKGTERQVRVFQELKVDHKKKYAKVIDNWFNRTYLISIQIRDQANISSNKHKLTFHSFRHTINTMLTGRVDARLMDAYIGHSLGETKDFYTHQMVASMNELLMPHIQFPYLDWKGLKKDWGSSSWL